MKFDLAFLLFVLTFSVSDQQSVKDFQRPFRVLEGLIIDKNFFLLRALTAEEKLTGIVDLDDPFGEREKLVVPKLKTGIRKDGDFTISSLFPSADESAFTNSKNLFRNTIESESRQQLRPASEKTSSKKNETVESSSSKLPSSVKTPQLKINRGESKATSGRGAGSASGNIASDTIRPIGFNRLRGISPAKVRKPIRTRTRRVQRIIKVIPAAPSVQAAPTKPATFSASSGSVSASTGSISASTNSLATAPVNVAATNSKSSSKRKQNRAPVVFGVTGRRLAANNPANNRGKTTTPVQISNSPSVETGAVFSNRRTSPPATVSSVKSSNSASKSGVSFQSDENSIKKLMKRLPGGSEKVLKTMSKTVFSCVGRPYGYYADMGSNCQIFHICSPVTHPDGYQENLRHSFFCNNGTVFDQQTLSCQDIAVAMDCHQAEKFYTAVPFFEKFNIFDRLRKQHEENQQRVARRVARRVAASIKRQDAILDA